MSIFTTKFVDLIKEYVDKHYITNINEVIEASNKVYNESTTFYDRHFKLLYLISRISRLVIPISTHYIYLYPDTDANAFLSEVFVSVFNVASLHSGIDIYKKLYTFVTNQIDKTRYSDRKMWERLKILGVTPETTTEEVMTKIITNTIPKYDFDKNLMNLNITVIDRTVRLYTLRKPDPYTLYALNDSDIISSDDDSIVSEAEVFDSYNSKRDEYVLFFRKYGTKQTINKIMIREGVSHIDKDEYDFYLNSFEFHDFHKFIIIQTYSRYFGGSENILACKKEEWVVLLIILIKILKRTELDYLIPFVTGIKRSYAVKRANKHLIKLIEENPLYDVLLKTKYRYVKNLLESKNIIKNTIISLLNNVYAYNEYGNPKNGELIEKDDNLIIENVLKMFNQIIL